MELKKGFWEVVAKLKYGWYLLMLVVVVYCSIELKRFSNGEILLLDKYFTEKNNARRDKDFQDLQEFPSVKGIDDFVKNYPRDVRIGKLLENKQALINRDRKQQLWQYVGKNIKPSLDSLWMLRELLPEGEQLNQIDRMISLMFDNEIQQHTILKDVQKYASLYPDNKRQIKSQYKSLENIYYRKATKFNTHWHCFEYLKIIPGEYRLKNKEIYELANKSGETNIPPSILSGNFFTGDATTITIFGAPIHLQFDENISTPLELSILTDDMQYRGARAEINNNTISIKTKQNHMYHEFGTFRYYKQNGRVFLESVYGSRNGYMRFYLSQQPL